MKNRIISIVNNKGGVGKTTTTINLASALAKLSLKVLIVDMDTQASLSKSLGVMNCSEGTAYALSGKRPSIVTREEGYDLLPADNALVAFEQEVMSLPARELRLKKALEQWGQDYDVTLVDCPPTMGLLTYNALVASHYYIMPVECEVMALAGTVKMKEVTDLIRQYLNEDLRLLGVVLTKYDQRKILNRQTLDLVRTQYPNEVFETPIRDNVTLAEAPAKRTDIFHYAPRSYGAMDYNNLAREVVERLCEHSC